MCWLSGGPTRRAQAALSFARHARKVTVLVRGTLPWEGMSQYLADRIAETANIEVLTRAEVTAAHGDGRLEAVDITLGEGREARCLDASAMFIFIGSAPRRKRLVAAFVHGKGLIETGDLKDASDLLIGTDDSKRAICGVQPLGCADQHAQGRRVDERHLREIDNQVASARSDARIECFMKLSAV